MNKATLSALALCVGAVLWAGTARAQVPAIPEFYKAGPGTTAGFNQWWWSGGAKASFGPNGGGTMGGVPVTTTPSNPQNLSGWKPASNFGAAPTATGATYNAASTWKPPGGTSIPINLAGKVTGAALGAAVLTMAKGPLPLIIGFGIYDLIKELGFNANKNGAGELILTKNTGGVADNFDYSRDGGTVWDATLQQSCQKNADYKNLNQNKAGTWELYTVNGVIGATANGGSGRCFYNTALQNCTNCSQYNQNNIESTGATARIKQIFTNSQSPATHQELVDKIAQQAGWPQTSNVANAIKDIEASGGVLPMTAPTVTGPATSPPVVKTTTSVVNNQTTTTTTTTTNNFNYAGNTISITTTTKTDVTKPDGTTTTETKTTDEPKEQPEEAPAVKTPMPEQPQLYEREFPNGLTGVWNTRKAELTQSPLFSLAGALMPSIAPGGTCPSWPLQLNVGIRNFGTYDAAPPCSIWQFGAAIIIISALLLARSLVFGG